MLLTPTERLWLYLAGVVFAAAAGFAGAFWLCIGLGGYRPGLFGFWWGCIWATIWVWFSILHERRRSLDDLDRTALRIKEGEAVHKKLWGEDVIEMPEKRTHEFTVRAIKPDGEYIQDLTRAHGGNNALIAERHARAFLAHVLKLGKITNRDCEKMCGGRIPYECMREVLIGVGLIEQVGKTYRALPHRRE
jgi:hypothetical protein